MRYFIIAVVMAVLGMAGFIFNSKLLRQDVVVEAVEIDTARAVIPGTIRVEASYDTAIRSDEAGRILEVLVEEGQEVSEGDTVARMDTGDLELELEALQINLSQARKQMEIGNAHRFGFQVARETLEEEKRLFDLGQRSEKQVKSAERGFQMSKEDLELSELLASSNIERLENAIRVMNRRLEKMVIQTPMVGIIDEVHAYKGDLISRGHSIASLISKEREVRAELNEENFAGIRVGQKAKVRFLSHGANLYDAEVVKILPSANPDTQRYAVQLEVDIAQHLLAPGLTGEVSINVGERPGARIIPTRALVGDRVFVVNSDNRLEYRQVEFGFRSLSRTEILSGLEEGELVVVEELERFREGDRVSIRKR